MQGLDAIIPTGYLRLAKLVRSSFPPNSNLGGKNKSNVLPNCQRAIIKWQQLFIIIYWSSFLPNSNLGGKDDQPQNYMRHTVPAYFVVDFPRNNYAVLAISEIEHSLYEIHFP